MSTRLNPPPEPSAAPTEPEGEVLLLDRAVRGLAQHVEALRARSNGEPAVFFTQWAAWRAGWTRFAAERTATPEAPMSAEDRARLRSYVTQYDAIRISVLRALGASPPSDSRAASNAPPNSPRDGWPRWVWASLLGAGVSVAFYALRERSS